MEHDALTYGGGTYYFQTNWLFGEDLESQKPSVKILTTRSILPAWEYLQLSPRYEPHGDPPAWPNMAKHGH